MASLAKLFWLVPLLPGAGALLLLLSGRWLPRRMAARLDCSTVLVSFALSAAGFAHLARAAEGQAGLSKTLLPWISSGAFTASVTLVFDELAAVMALVVTGVGFLIHVYSTAYMAEDRLYSRYFAFLNLFTFFMLVLVLPRLPPGLAAWAHESRGQ